MLQSTVRVHSYEDSFTFVLLIPKVLLVDLLAGYGAVPCLLCPNIADYIPNYGFKSQTRWLDYKVRSYI